ncbi:MAG: DUF6526 family protein [Candidatus Sulfotelmatobacter sp.]
MAEKKPQTLANHSRLDPPFRFFVLPVFGLSAIAAAVHFFWHPSWHSAAFFVVAAGAATAVVRFRQYSLKVQDRVIRLEERLRLAALLPEPLRSRIPELTERQLIALRFASDVEIPRLANELCPRSYHRRISRKRFRFGVLTIGASEIARLALEDACSMHLFQTFGTVFAV